MRADANLVVKDCSQNLELYQGHRVRVAHQKKEINNMEREMSQRCVEEKGSDKAQVVIDWKMKCLARYHRETTTQHFSKRRISWHGACIH